MSSAAAADSLSSEASAYFELSTVAAPGGVLTDFAFLPDNRIVITDKEGGVSLRTATGTLTSAGGFAVDTASEKRLLGVAVDPDFTATRRLFFY